jgi:ferredoxin
MRIIADTHTCEGLGMCEAMAPEYFEVGDDGHVVVHDDHPVEADRQDITAAVDACPVLALSLQE